MASPDAQASLIPAIPQDALESLAGLGLRYAD